MSLRNAPSIQNLQQSLSLHRRLLSMISTPRSEDEVIRLVIDSLFEHFQEYRCTFSKVTEEGEIQIIYSRAAVGHPPFSGKKLNIANVDGLHESFRVGLVSVIGDVRAQPGMSKYAEALVNFGGNPSRIDVPVPDYDGNIFLLSLTHWQPVSWDEATVQLLREVAEPVGLLLRDARTREKLQRSEELFREFAENLHAVVWMTDVPESRIVYVSPQYEKIWGRSSEHLYESRLSLLETIHPDDRARMTVALARQALEDYQEEYRILRPDGEVRWVRDRGFHVPGQHGLPRRVVGIAEDITPLREAELRLEATRAQIFSNAKFAALGEMASGIAHEINNPLAVIHGLSVQLQELFHEQLNPSTMVLDSLATMEKMANRIAGIVKGLRTFSRTSDGDRMTPDDLNAITQETAAMCEPKLRESGVRFSVFLAPYAVPVRCRSSEISQVILNLVNNAHDAVADMDGAWVRIEVEIEGSLARIQVKDSGPGVSPEARDRIFQPFFTTKEVGKGTGLGLSISKGIVEAHGGVLFLVPEAKITTFVVELPALDAP